MMTHHTITRRALLKASPAIAAIAALPVAANALVHDTPETTPAFDLQAWLDEQTPAQRVNYHQTKLAEAMCDHNPGKWRTFFNDQLDVIGVMRDPMAADERPSVFVKYFY